MTKRYAVYWVDAFTSRPFGGNGCAVVLDAGDLCTETCKAFVRETSLVECTFVEHSAQADVKVRYFVASNEIPFAGHPTIATAASLRDRGILTGPRMTFETGAGLIGVEVSETDTGPLFTMRQAPPVFGAQADPAKVAAIFGLSADDVVGVPQLTSTGLPFTITVIRSKDALRRAVVNQDLLLEHCLSMGADDAHAFEPYLVTLDGATDAGRTFARLFLAPPSPIEDPFTGCATGATAAYLWKHGLVDTRTYIAEQGHDMGRPGQAHVRIDGPDGTPEHIFVGGQGHVLMSGDLRL